LTTVATGSPADIYGKLHKYDVVTAVNDQPIHSSDDLFLALGTQLAGNKVTLDVLVQGKQKTQVEVSLAKLHVPSKKVVSSLGSRPFFRGMRVDYASLLVQQPSRATYLPKGVLITEVQANSS